MAVPLNRQGIVVIPSWYPSVQDPVAGIFVQQQAGALHRAGLKISIFWVQESLSPIRSDDQYALEDDLPVYRLRAFVFPKRIHVLRWRWYRQWEALLLKYREREGEYPRLLHAHSFVAGAAARYLSKKYDIPYVITEHYDGFVSGKIPAHWRPELPLIYRDADRVLAVSAGLAAAMQPYCREVTVVPNMIDTSLFLPGSGSVVDRKRGYKRLISVGSLVARKNFPLLLHTVAEIRPECPVELVIVGDGPQRAELQRLANDLGLQAQVHFTGALSPAQVAAQLQSADLYVSVSSSESFALAPVEALACGVPVVLLRCGSVLEQAELPLVTIVDQAQQLGPAIQQGMQPAKEADVTAAQAYVQDHFAPAAVAGQLQEVYKKWLD